MALFVNKWPVGTCIHLSASGLRTEPRDIFITMFAFEEAEGSGLRA